MSIKRCVKSRFLKCSVWPTCTIWSNSYIYLWIRARLHSFLVLDCCLRRGSGVWALAEQPPSSCILSLLSASCLIGAEWLFLLGFCFFFIFSEQWIRISLEKKERNPITTPITFLLVNHITHSYSSFLWTHERSVSKLRFRYASTR
jgi:hypothetical protein